ncbi:lipocalin family protein [Azohydromonas aeria]|uniref:lipocalin family protein n=1 Tax=Azohydromonas aeria TaxID=2590212 RepID=UPI001E64A4F6|nr:lipocalin family protein [Azohydromonas aeria]
MDTRTTNSLTTMLQRAAATALLLAAVGAGAQDGAGEPAKPAGHGVTTIPALDVPRYMGPWFEIAKFPNRFQAKCVADTSARYALRPDGRVEVVNRCRLADGQIEEAVGVARQVGETSSPKLQVRFAPRWLSWLPFVWGDYWVLDLDDAYQLAAVGDPAREYLWILSRTPAVDPAAFEALMQRLRRQGFDMDRLERTVQNAP